MSKTYIGRRMQSFESAPQFDSYSRVEIIVSEDLTYTAGTDTGRTLTIENPWGTQAMADNILAKIKNFRYKPYTADGALLDPSAELGDGITANGLYSGIYAIETKYGKLLRAKVSAPAEDELESEYPYTSRSERRVQRKLTGLTTKTAELEVNVEGITATVTAITEKGGTLDTIQSTLTQQAGEIEAKVSHTKDGGDTANSFGWTLTEDSWTIKANGTNVLVAKKEGLEIEGKITAKTGKIGGFDIESNYLSYNKLTWDGTGYGAYIGVSGIQLGSNFKVDMNGDITAKNITATGGTIGGFDIESNYLSYNKLTWDGTGYGAYIGISGIQLGSNFKVDMNGQITATGGKIGGFNIGANSLSYNDLTFGSTNQLGVYLGPDGIQLGNAFKVGLDGSLTATNGTFTGNVYAGSIQYGTGTDPVTGMQYGTVSGSALTAASVTSTQTSEAIQTSLSYADNANNIFTGVSDARFNSSRLYIDNHKLTRSTISIDGHQVNVVTWVSTEG